MVLGMSLPAFTALHVALSLFGIAAWLEWLHGVLASRHYAFWTAAFLASTLLTSVTGFLFPFERVLPSHIFGVLSLALLAVTLPALYLHRLAGRWRWLYVVTGLAALYLNAFVAVVQAFLKLPFLQALAPTQTEPPFLAAQAALLIAFVVLGARGVRAFHPRPSTALRPA